ncbi:glycosyltransferase family 2 protein [uncultured Paracoccus sp.]|uniref:glycosyltransferase n=1 Tax=uncultured Paracoccus sp. TaxID=189685 RepID=UPI00262E606A|nr:glycosyltransferase family 2 protein [uncultured Paracoccus sp.]
MDELLVDVPLAGRQLLSPSLATAPCGDAVVCVPARNEAQRLPALIAGLDRQAGFGDRKVRVLLLLNNCTDASRSTAERAAAAASRVEMRIVQRSFPAAAAHAGSARRAAMGSGAAWLDDIGARDGVLLTTDADAVPAADWVARSCAALAAGADIAAAALIGAPDEEARFARPLRRAVDAWMEARRLAVLLEEAVDPVPGDPAPRHWDHSGGGLALRLATYRAAGGCPAMPFREDLALVEAVRRLGGIVRHCPSIRVTVSARMQGRAAGGMADTIRAWAAQAEAGAPVMAPDPAVMEAQWRARAAVRAAAAKATGHLPATLAARALAAYVAKHCPDPVDWPAEIPAPDATRILERRLDDLLRVCPAA